MNPDQIKNSIQAVIDGLTPLAQKLQIPLEGIFHWAVLHNYGIAISETLAFLLGIILIAIGIRYLKNAKWSYGTPENYQAGLATAFLAVGCVVTLIGGIAFFIEGLPRLVAPQWAAAQDIHDLVFPPKS